MALATGLPRACYYSAAALSIEAFERPPQGRFVRNAGSMILLFAIGEQELQVWRIVLFWGGSA
jgi:hypothetical protein